MQPLRKAIFEELNLGQFEALEHLKRPVLLWMFAQASAMSDVIIVLDKEDILKKRDKGIFNALLI